MSELDSIQSKDEIKWAQRAKVEWLREWDSNTAFFHRTTSQKKRINHIPQIIVGNTTLNSKKAISEAFTNNFKAQLAFNHIPQLAVNWELLHPEDAIDMSSLETDFSEDEIKMAIFTLGPGKSPRLHGFPILFFRRYWEVLKHDVMENFQD